MGVEIIQFLSTKEDKERAEAEILEYTRRGLEIASTAVGAPNEQGIFATTVIMLLKPKGGRY